MKTEEENEQAETTGESWCKCMECEWEGQLKDCDTEYEHDEFWGKDYPYPICPECSGGVEY